MLHSCPAINRKSQICPRHSACGFALPKVYERSCPAGHPVPASQNIGEKRAKQPRSAIADAELCIGELKPTCVWRCPSCRRVSSRHKRTELRRLVPERGEYFDLPRAISQGPSNTLLSYLSTIGRLCCSAVAALRLLFAFQVG